MDRELVDIVLHKSFVELSANERKDLLEWCSNEEEFDQMKNVFVEVELMKKQQTETVRPKTKKSLDVLFAEKHKIGGSIIWNSSVVTAMYPVEKPFHRRPLVQIAALALLLLFSYPILQNSKSNSESSQLANNEPTKGSNMKKVPFVPVVKEEKLEKESENKKENNSLSNIQVAKVEIQKTNNNGLVTLNGGPSFSVSNDIASSPVMSATSKYSTASVTNTTIAGATYFYSGSVDAHASTFSQPDGLYEGDENTIKYSKPVSENSSVLDLLIVTF